MEIKNISDLLRQIASDLENNKLTEQDTEKILEFYTNWTYEKEAENKEIERKEFYKFFTLGWVFYKMILEK